MHSSQPPHRDNVMHVTTISSLLREVITARSLHSSVYLQYVLSVVNYTCITIVILYVM